MATAEVLHLCFRAGSVYCGFMWGGDRCGVAGAWAEDAAECDHALALVSLSSQILNQNVMRLQQLARGVLDGGYCKLVGNLRLQNA